jgi:hypothetical protein
VPKEENTVPKEAASTLARMAKKPETDRHLAVSTTGSDNLRDKKLRRNYTKICVFYVDLMKIAAPV